jgi:hypothetical protein
LGGADLKRSLDRIREYVQWARYRCEVSRLGCVAVLGLTALLILLMPFTEHFCRWDSFPQGGPDLEFFVLCVLLLVGLVLVMAHRSAASPFFRLLTHRLVILSDRSFSMFGHRPSSSVLSGRGAGQGADPALLPHSGIPLRI